jgi:OmcA/MtrC family decaheme c-type cytochrome
VATLKGTGTKKFPVGAKLRAVGLQGYFTQIAPAAARHAISVVKAVDGDTARRTVVDKTKCSNCHEWFEGHGGNRVYDTQICVMCHVPGLATSGRGISDAKLAAYPFSAADNKILKEWGFDKTLPNAALQFPVTSNTFKDMIHGIHSGRDRVTPFQDARDRTPSAITLLDFRRMDFPGVLSNCNTCHVSSTSATTTFNTVPADTLVSTYESIDAGYAAAITGGTATTADALRSLSTANDTDTASSPFAAACSSCHDNVPAKNHMTQNGGAIKVTRSQAKMAPEACAICHGPGTEFDTAVVHK